MLLGGGRAAPWLPPALLPPEVGLPHLARSPPTALKGPTRTISPAPQQLPFVGVPAALPLPPFLSPGSKKSPRRSPRRPWHVHLLPPGAGNTPLGGHGDPRRGGLAALRPLLQPRRGHPAGSTSRTPQALPKAGLGQQLGHTPALKVSWPSKSNYQAVKENKGLKTAEKVSVLLTVQVALLSPPVLLSPPFPGAMPTASSLCP